MLDVSTFVARCRGMMSKPEATIRDHVQPVPPWTVVAREHLVPLIVLTAAVSTVLIRVFPPPFLVDHPGALGLEVLLLQFVFKIFINLVAVVVVSGVVLFFAGVFGGRATFSAAFVMVALAATPYFLAEAVLPLPVIGGIAWVAGLVYALVLLYKAGPLALRLPWQNRGKHFAMSILSLLLIAMLAGTALVPVFEPMAGSTVGP